MRNTTKSCTKSKIRHYVRTPKLERYVRILVDMYVRNGISRAMLNSYLADVLPEGRWIDCGPYSVRYDNDFGLPIITFAGRFFSHSGVCPVCKEREFRWVSGEGLSVQVWCMKCSCIYRTTERVLACNQLKEKAPFLRR